MVLSVVTTTTVSAISVTTAVGLGVGGALITILLVLLLSSRELITASSYRSRKTLAVFDAAIIPLLVVFVLTIAYQVLEIVHPIA
jgi:hypothetical protein